jgi:hypothetical protein
MGEVVSCHADLFPCPVGGQTRGPCLHMNRGRPKGCWGVPCSLSCARQGGSGQREGGVPFAQRLASPICAQRWGGTNPVHGGWCQQGTSGGVHRRAMWHQGGGGEGVCLHPLCVCFLAKGGGHCQQVEVRGGRVGDRSFPHVSRIHGDALLFMHCFALFSFILTFVFSRKYKIDKTFKKRSLKIGAHKAGRTV